MASALSSSSPTPFLSSPENNAEAIEPKLKCDAVEDQEVSEEPQSSSSFSIDTESPCVIPEASAYGESDDHRVRRPALPQDDPLHFGRVPRSRKSLPRVPPSKRPGALSGHLPIYTPPNPILSSPHLTCDLSEPDDYSWDPIMTPTRFIINEAPRVRRIGSSPQVRAHSSLEDQDEEDSNSRDGDDEDSEEEEENEDDDTEELRDKVEAAMSTPPAPQICCALHYRKHQPYPVILDDDSDPDAFRGFKTPNRTRPERGGRFYSRESCSEKSCIARELAEKEEQVVIPAYPIILDDDADPEAFKGFKTRTGVLEEPRIPVYSPKSCSQTGFDGKEKEEQEQVVRSEKDEPVQDGGTDSEQEEMGRNNQHVVETSSDQENVDDDEAEEEDEENSGHTFGFVSLPLSLFPSLPSFGKCQKDAVITDDDSDPDAFANFRKQCRQRTLNPPSVDIAPVRQTKKSLTAAEQLAIETGPSGFISHSPFSLPKSLATPMRTRVRTWLQDISDRPLSPSAHGSLIMDKQNNVKEDNDLSAPQSD